MKTSSRIALQFSIWIAIISGILLVFLNTSFFIGWVRSEWQNMMPYINGPRIPPNRTIFKSNNFINQERIIFLDPTTFSPEQYKTLLWLDRIRYFNERRWFIGWNSEFYVWLDVSQNVDRQIWLFYISLLLWGSVSVWSFFFGRLFVHRSLRDLRNLIQKLDQRSLTEENPPLVAPHLPEDDEINTIATSITNLEDRISAHYANLRTFVGHVSHELKTPLMVMRSDIDLADRTKNYESMSDDLRLHINTMQNTVDTLLTLSRLQARDSIDTTTLDWYEIIEQICENLQKKYAHKNISYSLTKSSNIEIIEANEYLFRILITNILDNAWKYSDNNAAITLNWDLTKLTVSNPWHIDEETIKNMWEPFWQADKNRIDGIGIWLSIVQNIVRIHKRHISYQNNNDSIICTIQFS